MHITLPESFRAYASKNDVRTAVDHILNCNNRKKLEVPPDLDWDELPEFHSAVLAAHQVRCDYAILLHKLWNKVWGTALRSAGANLEPLSITETYEYEDADMYAYPIWENEEYGRYVRRNSRSKRVFWLTVRLDRKEAVLRLWAGERKRDIAVLRAAISAEGWNEEPENDDGEWFGRTTMGSAPIRKGELEISRLVLAAKGVLTKLADHAA